jgi:hypothetical protein
VASIEDVQGHLAIELEKFNSTESQGILSSVPQVQAKVADLKNLIEIMNEKELTEKALEVPEQEPFYQLPNWKQEIYPNEPSFPKRVEMLNELLQ